MRFDTAKKGRITQKFLENVVSIYKDNGLAGHTGIDYMLGYGKPVFCDNAGIVYKVIREGELPSNWAGVYMLCSDEKGAVEITYGHLSRIDVEEGQYVGAGTQVGLEGNKGDVFYGGLRITPEQQRAGDKRGSHVHEAWRPVAFKKKATTGEHYLRKKDGSLYEKQGFYEVMLNSDQTRGCIDPLLYATQTKDGTIASLQKQVIVLGYKLLSLLKK